MSPSPPRFWEWLKLRIYEVFDIGWIIGIGAFVKLAAIPTIDKELDCSPQRLNTTGKAA